MHTPLAWPRRCRGTSREPGTPESAESIEKVLLDIVRMKLTCEAAELPEVLRPTNSDSSDDAKDDGAARCACAVGLLGTFVSVCVSVCVSSHDSCKDTK